MKRSMPSPSQLRRFRSTVSGSKKSCSGMTTSSAVDGREDRRQSTSSRAVPLDARSASAIRTPGRHGHIIGDDQLGASTMEVERAHVRGDPVRRRPGPRRLAEGVVRRPEHRDEDLRFAYRTGMRAHHRHRLPGVVDAHLLAGTVLVAHHHVERRRPRPVPLAEPTILQPLGMDRLGLPPQQRQCHALATQLAVELAALRQRTRDPARHRHRVPAAVRVAHRRAIRPAASSSPPPRRGGCNPLPSMGTPSGCARSRGSSIPRRGTAADPLESCAWTTSCSPRNR